MLRKRILLYLAFAIYQITAFVFTVMVDGHLDLLGLLKYIPYFKYVTFFGVIMIGLDILWFWREHDDHTFHRNRLEQHNIDLKAKVTDLQEGSRDSENSSNA
jgi:hypothetical protein